MKYKLGLVIGFLAGALGPLALSATQTITRIITWVASVVLWPAKFIIEIFADPIDLNNSGMLLLAMVISGALYGALGMLIESFFAGDDEQVSEVDHMK